MALPAAAPEPYLSLPVRWTIYGLEFNPPLAVRIPLMRRSWVQIDLAALDENIASLRGGLTPETDIVFVVKANAYGHGAVRLARRASRSGIRWFGVAYVQEALELRTELPNEGILVMGAAEPEDVGVLLRERITPVVVSEEQGIALGDEAVARGGRLDVHLKIDTGMGRLGVDWNRAAEVYASLMGHPGLRITGVCSHFATVEPDDVEPAKEQVRRFNSFETARRRLDPRSVMRHLSSSRAAVYFRPWDFNAVRPGILLYGYGADEEGLSIRTRPILQWKSYVMQVRRVPAGFKIGYYSTYQTPAPTTLATLCVGYADGFLRTLSNRGVVLIGGRRCPVVGRVTMNWLTVDVGLDAAVEPGHEAVLIGKQGSEAIWAGELARRCRTIPYEILTNISASVERRYIG